MQPQTPHRAGAFSHAEPQALFHHGVAVHHRGDQLPRPQQPVHCRAGADQRAGHRPDARRPDLLRVRLDLRRHADARRLAGGPRAAAHPVQRRAGCCGRSPPCCLASPAASSRLFILRMAVGALEAPAYPINSRVVTAWFPEKRTRHRRSASTPPASSSAWPS